MFDPIYKKINYNIFYITTCALKISVCSNIIYQLIINFYSIQYEQE